VGLLSGLKRRLDTASLYFDISTGRKTWGRQPGPGDGSKIGATTLAKSTISAVVIRADGTVEDRGVLHSGEVELTAGQVSALQRQAKG
jgi:hypothetical protein